MLERWQALIDGEWVFVDDVRRHSQGVDEEMTFTVLGVFTDDFEQRYGPGPWRFMCWGSGDDGCSWRANDAGAAREHERMTGHVMQDVDPTYETRNQGTDCPHC